MSKHNVIIPIDMNPRPENHEISAAMILADYFCSDALFLKATGTNSPDISIKGVQWEIKSPIGSGKNNIRKSMREAAYQSVNIVIDLRRSKLHQTRALGYIKQYFAHPNRLKRVLVITKLEKVLEIK